MFANVPAPTGERLIFVGTSDFAGIVRGKAFPASDLEQRVRDGMGLTASNIMLSAFGPIYSTPFGTFGDLKLMPDLSTRAEVEAADGCGMELVLGDIRTLDDREWSCCPRSFLRRGLVQLEDEFGLVVRAAFEQEFVYTGVSEQAGSSYAFDRFRRAGGFAGRALSALRAAGVTPDSFLPEYGERQFEVTVKPRTGVRAADDAVLVREVFRAAAAQAGARAIFAPLLEPDGIGNGTHIHLSLEDTVGRPVMFDPDATFGVARVARPFLAGIVAHMPALTALTAPSVPSFFRLRPNKWAPTWANLGERDRGSALRICPTFCNDPTERAAQFNMEYRVGDATASPYLALGAIVAAGLDGLRRGLSLPIHPQGPQADFAAAGVRPLPSRLSDALDALEQTPAAHAWLGEECLAAYTMFKRSEIDAVAHLTEAEVCRRYVEVY